MGAVDADAFLADGEALADVYAAVFTRAPWHETPDQARTFLGRLPEEVATPGFRARIVRDAGGALAGFAYGYLTPSPFPAGRSYDDARAAVGESHAARLCGTFEVAELAVHPAAQGTGLGRRLLDELVGGGAAWLLTATYAQQAIRCYERQGWQHAGTANGIVVYTSPPVG